METRKNLKGRRGRRTEELPARGEGRGRDDDPRFRGGSPRGRRAAGPSAPELDPLHEIIAGRRAAIETLRSDRSISRILIAEGIPDRGIIGDIGRLAQSNGVHVDRVSRREIDALSGEVENQGVIVIANPFTYAELEDVIAAAEAPGRIPVIAVLDEVSDPRNLGAVLRCADGAGIGGVIVTKRRSAQMTPAAVKTAAGAEEHIPVARVSNLASALEELKKAGYWVIGASSEADQDIWGADLSGKTVFVLGSEGAGMRPLVEKNCDSLIKIPMSGKVESLNVSVAAALMFYEARRRSAGGTP